MIEASGAWQILFYRSIALSLFLFVVIAVHHKAQTVRAILSVGFPGVLGALCLVFAYAFGILAMQKTSIADAVLLFATAPFFAALLGLIFLRERVRKSTWFAIGFAMVGIVVMQGGAIATGNAAGNLYALGSAFGFALFTIVLRWRKETDMVPTVFLSGLFAVVICYGVVSFDGVGVSVPRDDIVIASLMGIFQTGAGLILYTMGARSVPAAQLALLPLIEVVLSPIWVAIVIGEVPTGIFLVGGALVGIAIVGDALYVPKRRSST